MLRKCVPFASRELVITILWSRVHEFNGMQHQNLTFWDMVKLRALKPSQIFVVSAQLFWAVKVSKHFAPRRFVPRRH